MADDKLIIGGTHITNRLFVGTGKFSSYTLMKEVILASEAQIVTVALRRVDAGSKGDNILEYIPKTCIVMTNTSGARTADEAVRIARLARAAGVGNWVKIEVVRDNTYLLPDNFETLRAVEILSREGFIVLPYISPDVAMAKRIAEAGAAAVMPLGSPIGSNRGLKTGELVEIMVHEVQVPVIVDAGIGRPSHACECMELGCAAVLINTALAVSPDPAVTAFAFKNAVIAGRAAYVSGFPSARQSGGSASSPLTGFLRDTD